MRVIEAPNEITGRGPMLFLAGSIEMGTTVDWQAAVITLLSGSAITVLNPRRRDWDATWEQSIHNQQLYEQVTWELEAMERADAILMYFAPGTKSPISLLELGLFARSGKLTVVCPDGFWRKGNVDIVCDRYRVEQVISVERFLQRLLAKVCY